MRQGFKGWSEAAVGEQRRVDAAGERAEAGERVCELGTGGVQELNSRGVRDPGLKELQIEGERDELLLGAVVEVTFELLACFEACLDDALSRGA